MITIEQISDEVTKVVQDFLDAGNYTNFRELMVDIYKEMNSAMRHVAAIDDKIPEGMRFKMYQILCFVEDAVQTEYRFDEEYTKDCQRVSQIFTSFNKIVKNHLKYTATLSV